MKSFDGGKLQHLDTRSDMQKQMDDFIGYIPYFAQLLPDQAKHMKKKYDSLIKEGFTEAQAMDIIKTRPIFE